MNRTGYQAETEILFRRHRVETILKSIIHTATGNNYSFAVWKRPFNSEIHCLVNLSDTPGWCEPELESLAPGFIFSPFDNNDNKRILFLAADIYFKWKPGDLWTVKSGIPGENHPKSEQFLDKVFNRLNRPDSGRPQLYHDSDLDLSPASKRYYTDILKQSIKAIKAGRFDKVVPSRYKSLKLKKEIDPVQKFLEVSKAYANSFISLVSTPFSGTWLGASPEILISLENNEIFRTTSVAGTKTYKPRTRLSEVAWTQKEIEEQALVSRYIVNCFKKIRLREFSELGPKTVKAGNLLHLKTLFTVNMKETNFLQLGSVMLRLLHPTSAICGMPKDEARSFLLKAENYNRKYYTGYLGPHDIDGKSDLFVNIRCSNILSDRALFYAGAGVTIDSVPLKEWKETEMKIQSLLRFFK